MSKPEGSEDNSQVEPVVSPATWVWKLPGVLGFVLPMRADLGLQDWNSTRSNMIRLLARQGHLRDVIPVEDQPGPALDVLGSAERAALLLSLATTLCRAEYHEHRFWRIVEHLAERRRLIGAPLGFDAFVGAAVFEAGAALGASRTIVDEVVHVAARRNGRDKWEVSKILHVPRPETHVSEVQLLRARRPWFDELNKCRNVLHHQGWRGDVAAYFPPDADEPEARNPSRNILLVPDLESLKNNSRSLNWTYKNATHLEGVVRRALDGLREFLDAVCLGVWDGKTPKPRTDPSAAQPNAMITYPRPVPLHDSSTMHLPVFSTEELARSFTGYPNGIPATVVSVPLLNVLFPEPAFAISLAGFESEVAKGVRVTIVVDPVDGTLKQRRLSPSVPEQLLSSPPFLDPLGLLQSVMQANRLFCWQQTP